MKIKKGDKIQVLVGKDRGRTGTVERVYPKKDRLVVTGVNVYKRHVRKQGQVEGGIIDIIKPINLSNVALVCSICKKPTRVGFKLLDKTKKRICKRCQTVI